MRVLITGATGFVGRAVAAALRARGDEVRGLVHPPGAAPARARLERLGVRLVDGQVEAEGAVEQAVTGCDAVVHAAERPPGEGTLAEHERVNLIGTENVLEACQRAGVGRLVFVSSEAVTAGNYPRDFVDESFPQPDAFFDPYAQTKALAEDVVVGANGIRGLSTVVVRPGWVWGPDDDALLPELIRRRRDRTLTLIAGGQHFVPSTFVGNLADALVRATTAPAAAGNVYYVTDDERVTCRAFLARLLGAAGLDAPRKNLPYWLAWALATVAEQTSARPFLTRREVVRFGRVALFNVKRARDDLGYAPVVSVTEGMRQLGAWVQAVGGADAIATGRVLEPAASP